MTAPTTAEHWDPKKYETHAGFVPVMTNAITDQLHQRVQPGDRVLDLGCGHGKLTKVLQDDDGYDVVGVDSSAAMVDAARAEGCRDVRVADGHDLAAAGIASGEFDAVFSNAALHWMKRDPHQVAQEVHRVLKPGGCFVAEMGGFLNVAVIHVALINAVTSRGHDGLALSPWYFPSQDDYRGVLESNGFAVEAIDLVPRITPLPTDVKGWLRTFGGPFLEPFTDPAEREAILDEVQTQLAPALCRQGKWAVMYNRLRIVARKR
ncbi:hypothetical protein IWQ60_003360 [Tieghemiomyces parasiticus]|uniref:Methyltransferase type 11 domain-containing protein n=1 Tax=Tieghemiomyces parasiticus TaxID=78921 RepID=A0A9W8DUW2_9FUNG|nr:hypothetical protein IWQ60_003360 [Tieghemiomyces parasiticus]